MSRGLEEKVFDAKTTTDAYVDSRLVEFLNYVRGAVYIKNTHGSNSIDYKVLGRYSVQDSDADWQEEVAETALAAGVDGVHAITKAYALLKVQIKATSGGSQGTVDCFVVKKRY